ncbi:MAG: hypothetical protein K6D38_02280 [Pseudobutyrivibrio sp.]|nr:hypothetical protein [Pseudobutyrivibrio sp.]
MTNNNNHNITDMYRSAFKSLMKKNEFLLKELEVLENAREVCLNKMRGILNEDIDVEDYYFGINYIRNILNNDINICSINLAELAAKNESTGYRKTLHNLQNRLENTKHMIKTEYGKYEEQNKHNKSDNFIINNIDNQIEVNRDIINHANVYISKFDAYKNQIIKVTDVYNINNSRKIEGDYNRKILALKNVIADARLNNDSLNVMKKLIRSDENRVYIDREICNFAYGLINSTQKELQRLKNERLKDDIIYLKKCSLYKSEKYSDINYVNNRINYYRDNMDKYTHNINMLAEEACNFIEQVDQDFIYGEGGQLLEEGLGDLENATSELEELDDNISVFDNLMGDKEYLLEEDKVRFAEIANRIEEITPHVLYLMDNARVCFNKSNVMYKQITDFKPRKFETKYNSESMLNREINRSSTSTSFSQRRMTI